MVRGLHVASPDYLAGIVRQRALPLRLRSKPNFLSTSMAERTLKAVIGRQRRHTLRGGAAQQRAFADAEGLCHSTEWRMA